RKARSRFGFGRSSTIVCKVTIPPWMTLQIPLKSLFGHRLHGGLASLPGLRSTGSCPCHSCQLTCLQAGSARWCLSLRWRCSPGPSLLSPGPVRTSPPTCRPPPSSRADRTASLEFYFDRIGDCKKQIPRLLIEDFGTLVVGWTVVLLGIATVRG